MSIIITQKSLLPVRRDGQISSINVSVSSAGGNSGSGTGTGGGTIYVGSSSISIGGTTISAIFGSGSTQVSCGSHLHTGVYLPILGCAYDSARLNNQSASFYAPIDSPNFITCIKSPIVCSTGVVKGTVITGSTCVSSPLVYATNITLICNEGSPSFSSGFAGAGWLLNNNSGSYDLTVDTVVVRKWLKAYALQISKLSAINGGMIISVAAAKTTTFTGTSISIDTNSGHNPIQFIVNDFVRAQQYDNGALYFQGQVTGIYSSYITVTVITGSIFQNMDLVQVGHPTDTSRQSIIYLSASDTNNPFIDMIAGVTDGNFSGKQVVRLGNLNGITDSSLGALSGAGLYSTNVYLTGKVVLPNAGVTNEGASASCIRFYAGCDYAHRTTAPFRITQDGSLTAEGVSSFGTTAANGSNLKLMGSSISDTSYAADGGTVYINYMGYQGGSSYFRNFIVGNGKGNNGLLIYAQGNPKRVSINTNIAPDSTFQVGTTNGAGLKINYNEGGTNNIYGALTSDNTITATNFILSSDERLKENIQSLGVAPLNVEYKQFNLKSDPKQLRFGLVAQDIIEKYPELVYKGCDGMLGISYTDLLIREVASLKCEMKQIKEDLNYYKNYNDRN